MSTSLAVGRLRTLLPLAALLSGALAFQVANAYEAKAKAPARTLESLLAPENRAKLAGILTYQAVAGKVAATVPRSGGRGVLSSAERTQATSVP